MLRSLPLFVAYWMIGRWMIGHQTIADPETPLHHWGYLKLWITCPNPEMMRYAVGSLDLPSS